MRIAGRIWAGRGHTRRLTSTVAAAVAVLVVAACGSDECPPEGSCYIVTEALQGRLIRLRCTLIAEPGRPESLISLEGLDSDFGVCQFYDGISGSPVYRASGELVGLISEVAESMPTRSGRFVDIGAIKAELARVVSGLPTFGSAERPRADAGPPAIVAAGEHVIVADIWGDILRGSSGTLGYERDGLVVLYGHGVTREGSISKCLLRADIVARVAANEGASNWSDLLARPQIVVAPSEVIGEVFFDGRLGLYGRVGAAPPFVDITWTLAAGSEVGDETAIKFSLIRETEGLSGRVAWAVAQAARPAVGEGLLQISVVDADGGRPSAESSYTCESLDELKEHASSRIEAIIEGATSSANLKILIHQALGRP